jgi:hypothetical protein
MAAYCPLWAAVNLLLAPTEVQGLQAEEFANSLGQFLQSLAPAEAQP